MRFARGNPNRQGTSQGTGHPRAQHPGATSTRLITVLAGLAVLLAAAGLQAPRPADAAEAIVTIGATLDPAELRVAPGTQITWQNEDAERHRVRSSSGPEEFDSGNLDPGDRFSFTFNRVGSYEYLDARNEDAAGYHGRIVVTADVSPAVGGDPAGGGTAGDGAPAAASDVQVDIRDRAFLPAQVTVAAGGAVTWRNSDDRVHTATANDRSWDSGIFDTGGSYTRTFDAPGTINYFCVVHPDMTATIVVVAANAAATEDAGTSPTPDLSPDANDPAPATTPAGDAESETPSPALGSGQPPPGGASVAIVDFDYRPRPIEVAVGSTVRWRNDGAAPHTVTATDRAYDSGLMFAGDTFAQTYSTPGTFPYFCTIHPEMTGTVVVRAVASTTSPTDPAPSSAAPTSDGRAVDDPELPGPEASATGSTGLEDLSVQTAQAIDFDYLPGTIEVEPGTTVRWENTGAAPHTITARDASYDSGLLFTGDSYSQTYEEAGTFEYFCTLHPNMIGTIVVRQAIASPGTESDEPAATAPDPLAAGAIDVTTGATADAAPSTRAIQASGGLAEIYLATAIIVAAVAALVIAGTVTLAPRRK